MKGTILIRGMSDEEIAEKSPDDLKCNTGIKIMAFCRLSSLEKIEIIHGLIKSLEFDEDEKTQLLAALGEGGLTNIPGVKGSIRISTTPNKLKRGDG